jgi:hypothetical protein
VVLRPSLAAAGGRRALIAVWAVGQKVIDVCAANDSCCKHFAAESGLPLGALGPFAAQESITIDFLCASRCGLSHCLLEAHAIRWAGTELCANATYLLKLSKCVIRRSARRERHDRFILDTPPSKDRIRTH